ncbi:MAG: fumarylacetoacetate hydrolase family protein [bacterium]|nr:fumarylacetoacetate hydrolase family protein [bacterium]
MSDAMLYRFNNRSGLGTDWIVRISDSVHYLRDFSLSAWLRQSTGRVDEAINGLRKTAYEATTVSFNRAFGQQAASGDMTAPLFAPPIEADQEVWAAGVTYERSRDARQEEADDGGDVYARVYRAERPELFLKALGRNVVGQSWSVGIRRDSQWNVPEPELGVVLNPAMEVVGFTIGNDMSSRDIEGANPLYLPQAKMYTASCALGPGIMLVATDEIFDATIHMRIQRGGETAFEAEVSTQRIQRRLSELVDYLSRSNQHPNGVILLTGTGIVPPQDFTLAPGDVISITIEPIGTLTNTVKVV